MMNWEVEEMLLGTAEVARSWKGSLQNETGALITKMQESLLHLPPWKDTVRSLLLWQKVGWHRNLIGLYTQKYYFYHLFSPHVSSANTLR